MKKLLLLLLACFTFCLVKAQDTRAYTEQLKEELIADHSLVNYYKQQYSGTDTSVIGNVKPFYLVNPKPGIHRLPQDNMPCMVPDMNADVAIPNTWVGKTGVPFKGKSPRLPNPAKPFRLSPSRPLLLNPQQNTLTK